ncbi:MAG: DNA polymerase III subunit delta' [Actinobacteria bacterium]|nr:DNA polymerase III subunit delta' [Actinomycetota bacterium]
MSAWDALVGQDAAVNELSRAAQAAALGTRAGQGMTHAWLITGPPGSGRSTAAAAFASALQCRDLGCGACAICRGARTGTHPDVEIVRSETLSYSTDDARELIARSSIVPADAPWHVVIVEDADRFTDQAANVLLKVLEEPPPHLVWILCAPSPEGVLPTIRSRVRAVTLRTPSTSEVAAALQERYGIDPTMAAFAARASQGHIGRARALATDEGARLRRQEILRIPGALRDLSACFIAAGELLSSAMEDAAALTDVLDAEEEEELRRACGEGAEGVTKARLDRLSSKPLKDLQKMQKSRRTRAIRDQVDRALVDLLSYYRDVLVLQMGGGVALVNDETRTQLQQEAAASPAPDTARRLDAIERTRLAVHANGALPLVLEGLMVELKDPLVAVR